MSLCRAILIVVSLGSLAAGTAAAQWPGSAPAQPAPQDNSVWNSAPQPAPAQPANSPWDQPAAPARPAATSPWDQPAQSTMAPPPGASPWNQPQQQGEPPCVAEFIKLREATEKRGKAIQTASARKATPKEACGLFNAFTAAESKMIKYAIDNQQSCGIPAQIIDQMKKGHAQAEDIRTKVCNAAAAAPARAAAPSLSDALAAPVPNASNIKTGRGTYDTLTGAPPVGR